MRKGTNQSLLALYSIVSHLNYSFVNFISPVSTELVTEENYCNSWQLEVIKKNKQVNWKSVSIIIPQQIISWKKKWFWNSVAEYFIIKEILLIILWICWMFSLYFFSLSPFKHTGPVGQVKWIEKESSSDVSEKTEILVSISKDGRVTSWSIRKGFESNGIIISPSYNDQSLRLVHKEFCLNFVYAIYHTFYKYRNILIGWQM